MENKIKSYLDGLFIKANDCDVKEEFILELCSNLVEKYNDLTADGLSSEEAYQEVISGIGDVEEVVAFINANNKASDFDFSASFEGFETKLKDLAKSLEGPISDVAKDIKNAAVSAKEPIKEMAKQVKHEMKHVGRDIKDVVSSMSASQSGKNTFRYDYKVDSEEVTCLDITASSGDVTFGLSEDESIYIVELSRQPLDEDKRADIGFRNGTLYLSHGKSSVSFIFFGMGVFKTDFEVYLPRKVFERITVKSSSGEIDLDQGLETDYLEIRSTSGEITGTEMRVDHLDIHTTSGDVVFRDLICKTVRGNSVSGDFFITGETTDCNINTTSGDVELNISALELSIKTVSGDIDINGPVENVMLKSTSGDVSAKFEEVPGTLKIDTISGDIKAHIPENEGFTLMYKRISGDIRSDFNLMTSINSKNGIGVYRNGELREYSMGTNSGDIRIYKY